MRYSVCAKKTWNPRLQRRISCGIALDATRKDHIRWVWGVYIPGARFGDDDQYGGKPLLRVPLSRWRRKAGGS